jgi:NAD(P)-dependent dehydrogenase (short-subunit alcohol dehydrogenase family)
VLCAAGLPQVLLGRDGAKLGSLAAALRAAGPGRVAVFAGDPADEADRAAALAMAQEQFGGVAVVVSSAAQARSMVAALEDGGTRATS